MADNIAITAGSGTSVRTDDIGGVHYQVVKIAHGADGSLDGLVDDASPMPVVQTGTLNVGTVTAVTSISNALPAGENFLGSVGGRTVVKDVTLSLDTSAYGSGDVLADTQQIDAALRKADGTGVIQSLVVVDKDDQKMAFTVYFLSANVAMGTENLAPSISDANAANILGFVDVLTSDYKDLGGVSVANIRGISMPVFAVSGTDDLYVAVVNGTGTPTYTASGVVLRVGILQD